MSAVELTGVLVCRDQSEVATVKHHLQRHCELTKAEPGCKYFEVKPTSDPKVWCVSEAFTDQHAYQLHQQRVRSSGWGEVTRGIIRRYAVRESEQWWVLLTDSIGPNLVTAQTGEYAFPGPQRDKLIAAILDGRKTATSTLLEEFNRTGETLPQAGDLEVVLASDRRPVCVTRTTQVSVERYADVSDDFARAEGEGFAGASDWRTAHRKFWTSAEFLQSLGKPSVPINDDTRIVLSTFEVLARF